MTTPRKEGLGNWKRPAVAADNRPAKELLIRHILSSLVASGSVRCALEVACDEDDEAGR